jgi:hypothetical protein
MTHQKLMKAVVSAGQSGLRSLANLCIQVIAIAGPANTPWAVHLRAGARSKAAIFAGLKVKSNFARHRLALSAVFAAIAGPPSPIRLKYWSTGRIGRLMPGLRPPRWTNRQSLNQKATFMYPISNLG